MGIVSEEEPYFQSERTDSYLRYARKLLELGAAYPCTVTPEELDKLREQQKANGEKPKYDGRCRPTERVPQDTTLPSIRSPQEGAVVFEDAILGTISTPAEELDDFIIVRSDGTPTYNFVNVVDDIEMQISHVLRGNEHVANTAKQIAIYKALEQPLPIFGHFPLILGSDKKKLSKRHGATAAIEYRKDGYLAEAFANYLARLGWSSGDKEIFSIKELCEEFALSGIGKSPSVFDIEKLRWVNAEHLRALGVDELFTELVPFLSEQLCSGDISAANKLLDISNRDVVLKEVAERSKTLIEAADALAWLKVDFTPTIEDKQKKKAFKQDFAPAWQELVASLSQLEKFDAESCKTSFETVLANHELGFGKLANPLRAALSGAGGGIALFAILEALGKKISISRIEAVSELFNE
ncbi:UNVERIFIED_CONTAM: hypothetical protein GTU68_041441 [Idotea baltica]|nr:hypothetical protein [Idotea baltica]